MNLMKHPKYFMMCIHAKNLAVYFWWCWATSMVLLNLIARVLLCEAILQQQKNLYTLKAHWQGKSLFRDGIYILKAQGPQPLLSTAAV